MNELLFSPSRIGARTLKNRLAMAPLYPGCAGEGGTVSDLLLEHPAGDQGPAFCVRRPHATRQALKAMFV